MRILVVDDERFIVDSISRILRAEGFTVTTADAEDRAMNLVKANKYDLVITDIMLPYAGGFDIVEIIKSDPEKKNTPVVIITGMDEDVLKTTHNRADACLIKPFTARQLIDTVKSLLPRAQAMA